MSYIYNIKNKKNSRIILGKLQNMDKINILSTNKPFTLIISITI